jgi:hypothetical protein
MMRFAGQAQYRRSRLNSNVRRHRNNALHEVLFIKHPLGTSNLAKCALDVFSVLGLQSYEERFSSNYPPDDHYYIARATNCAIEVSDADDEDLPQYKHWVAVTNWKLAASDQTLASADPREVAKELASAGFEVFLPSSGWPQVGWDQTGEYFLPLPSAPAATAGDA